MSQHYIIIPYQETTFYIESQYLKDFLTKQYLQAKFIPIFDMEDPFILEWEIPWIDRSLFRGFLSKDHQGITLRGSLEESAEFAVWLQQLYKEEKHLVFLDEQASFAVDLYGRRMEEVIALAKQEYFYFSPELKTDKLLK